jgi:hypothetical protein
MIDRTQNRFAVSADLLVSLHADPAVLHPGRRFRRNA